MILIYAITLGASAGLTGLFVRQALGEQGYVPGFTPGVMIACGAAAIYAGLQLLYVALVRLAWPTKTNWPLLGECVSHGAAVAFIPYLAHLKINWPHPALHGLEAFVYLAAFLLLHAALKLVAFYAILRSPPGTRLWNMAWAGGAALLLVAGSGMVDIWAASIEKARPRAPEEVKSYRAGTAYASARALPEGSVLSVNVTAQSGHCLMFACANPPDIPAEDALETAFLTVDMRGETTTHFTGPVDLDASGWSFLQVPADQLPRKLTSCQLRWSSEKESKWRRAIGILPVMSSNRTLLVEGPSVRETRGPETLPNFLIIVVDGLGPDRVSSMSAARGTTPNLDRLGQSALTFPFTYTPAPEAGAACMTLLTGVSPLRHGYLGEQRGPLPKECKTLQEALRSERYATAAFTEGEAWGDLVHGSGVERGFDFFDDGYEEPPSNAMAGSVQSGSAGSRQTLQKAREWIDAHKDVKYMAFVRLGDLREARTRERYGSALAQDTASSTPAAVYDAVIRALDKSIGEFVTRVRTAGSDKSTCIVLTSTRGGYLQEASLNADWTLRVPLLLCVPGVAPSKRNELVALEDVPPTLARVAHVTLGPFASTADLVNAPASREPISMMGNPLLLSIRNANLRLVWSTQRDPFTMKAAGLPAAAALYDLRTTRAGAQLQDISARNPDTTRKWTEKLEAYFAMQREGWQSGK